MKFFNKSINSYLLILGLLLSINPFSAEATNSPLGFEWIDTLTPKKVIGGSLVGLVLAALWTYHTKEDTAIKKRSLETCDGIADIGHYVWSDVIVGTEYQEERLNSIEVDPENPTHLIFKYQEKKPTGLVGNTHYYLKKLIIPTATFAILFNTFKSDIMKALTLLTPIIADPTNVLKITEKQ